MVENKFVMKMITNLIKHEMIDKRIDIYEFLLNINVINNNYNILTLLTLNYF